MLYQLVKMTGITLHNCQLNDFIVFDKFKVDKKFDLLPYISSNITGNRSNNSEKINYNKIKPNIGLGVNAELTKTLISGVNSKSRFLSSRGRCNKNRC